MEDIIDGETIHKLEIRVLINNAKKSNKEWTVVIRILIGTYKDDERKMLAATNDCGVSPIETPKRRILTNTKTYNSPYFRGTLPEANESRLTVESFSVYVAWPCKPI